MQLVKGVDAVSQGKLTDTNVAGRYIRPSNARLFRISLSREAFMLRSRSISASFCESLVSSVMVLLLDLRLSKEVKSKIDCA